MADTTTAPTTAARLRGRRLALLPALALVLAAGATACAQKASDAGFDVRTGDDGRSPEFEATADYLGQAVARSEAQAYRFSEGVNIDAMGQHMGGDDFITGVRKGKASSLTMDMGGLYKGMPGVSDLGGDLTMQMVTDGKTLYMRAPVFATLADKLGGSSSVPGPFGAFAALGDQWGRIDLGALGEDKAMGRLMSQAGGQGSDPGALLKVVKDADDPHDLGTDTVRGDKVHGLGATLTFEKLLAGQGVNIDDYFGSLGSSVPAEGKAILDSLRDLKMPIEVWVDDDAHVRRLVLDMDMSKLLGSLGGGEGGSGSMAVRTTMDLYDYGSPSIKVDIPAQSVDVTDEFVGNLTS
ncbi:MAG TPA: hypothetical protein VKB57_19380 [Acidimicrobiales bacterium]|nr:hypothetical protein [Acidimicrobiales bacterium]